MPRLRARHSSFREEVARNPAPDPPANVSHFVSFRMPAGMATSLDDPKPLWTPTADRVQRSSMTAFMRRAADQGYIAPPSASPADSFPELWEWSVRDRLAFWNLVREHCGLICGER